MCNYYIGVIVDTKLTKNFNISNISDMKLQFKKYIFLINDVTNLLLGKERENLARDFKKMKIAIIILGVFLVISVSVNVYLLIR